MRHVRLEKAATRREHFFNRKDPWGHGFSLWIVALMIFITPVAIYSLRHVRLKNDVENWLPANDPSALEYAWCRDHFPEKEVLFLTWEGSTVHDPRLPILIGKLQGQVQEDGVRRGGLPYVDSAMHAGTLLKRMVEYGVEQPEAVRRLEGMTLGQGPLKIRLTPAGKDHQQATIDRLLAGAKSQFGITLKTHPQVEIWSPTDAIADDFEALQDQFPPAQSDADVLPLQFGKHDFQVSWKGMTADSPAREDLIQWIDGFTDTDGTALVEECYFAPGSPIAVMISLTHAGVVEKTNALDAIRQVAADSMIPADDVILGGRIVSSSALNAGVLRAVWNKAATVPWQRSVIGLSGLVGILFALLSLKSIRLGLLVIGISYYAALIGMAVVPLTGGSMNMVLVVMPTLLMVLSLSGAIHVANYWKHSVWEDPSCAVARATQMASQPCLLAGVTTALGLISLAGSQLTPVRDFGIYAAIGVMLSVFLILYGLPSLLQMAPLRRVRPDDIDPRAWKRFGNWIGRYWRPLTVGYLGLAMLAAWGLKDFQVETKVIRYFPEHSQVVKDFQTMEDTLAGICPVEVVVRFDAAAQVEYRFLERLEVVRRIEEKLRQHPEVSGTLSLADFQPVRLPPGESASTREKIFFNRRSHEAERRVKDGEAAGAGDLIAMSKSTPLPTDPQRVGTDELWRINAQCDILSDADYNALTDELNSCVLQVTGQYDGIDHLVTGTVPLFLRTQRAVLDSLIWSFVMAFGLIAVVMIWVLKDVLAGIISMVPNIVPVVSVFGLVAWCGERIDIGTMVTASVALGIAVDGTLHLLTWFQDGLRRGLTRQESVTAALSHCGPAMWQTSAAVGLGLLVLFPADLLLISRFGWLMAALIGSAFLGDIILLPALLNGSLGKLIEARVKKSLEKEAATRDAVEEQPSAAIPAHHFPLTPSGERDEARYVS